MKSFFFIPIWIISLILVSLFVYENPEKVEIVKDFFSSKKKVVIESEEGELLRSYGNSFVIEFFKELSLSEKTAL